MHPTEIKNCIAFWDFQNSSLRSKGENQFTLVPSKKATFNNEGIFGPSSLELKKNYYYIPAKLCSTLNRAKDNSELTMIAWIKRQRQIFGNCEAIAGIWNETNKKRQYCLFLNIRITGGKNSVSGHVSHTGGSSLGSKFSKDVSVGKTAVPFNQWSTVSFSFDKEYARSYFNGNLDDWEAKNPYYYPGNLFNTEDKADFTIGAVNRAGKMGNWFCGLLGGLAIYSRALSNKEITSLTCNKERR